MAGSAPLGQLIVELGLQDSKFRSGMQGVRSQLRTLDSDFKTSQIAAASFGNKLGDLSRPSQIAKKQIEEQIKLLDKLKTGLNGSYVNNKATASTEAFSKQISSANLKLAQYGANLKEATKQEYLQSSAMNKTGNFLSAAGEKAKNFGNAMMPASVAVTGGLIKSVKAAASFESQFTSIRALLADGTPAKALGQQIDTLEEKSKSWATQYGISTESINSGIEELVKKGYSYNQTIGAMPAILNASKASGEDFNTVMSASTSILEQFGLKSSNTATMTKNTTRVTDDLSFVANKTAAGFSDMGEAMEYVGPVAKGTGMNLEDTASAIGLLSNNGIEGQSAGTGLRTVLTSLLKPTKSSSGALKELGVNVAGFKKGTVGLPDIIQSISDHTKGMTQAQKAALLAQAFGTKGQTAMNILVSQGADALRKLSGETKNATGYTKGLADQMNDSANNQFARAKEELEVTGITIGQKLLPTLVPAAKGIENLVSDFSKWSPEAQNVAIGLGLATAAAYPLSNVVGSLTGSAGSLLKVFANIRGNGLGKKALEEATSSAKDFVPVLGGVGASAEEGASSIGIMSTTLGTVLPVAAGVGAAALAAFGLYEFNKTLGESAREVSEYGAVVGPQTAAKLEVLHQKYGELEGASQVFDSTMTNSMKNGSSSAQEYNTKVSGALKNVQSAIKNMGTEASNSITDVEKAMQKGAAYAGLSTSDIANAKKGLEQQRANVKTITDQMDSIYQSAAKNQGKLSTAQRQTLQNDQQQLVKETITNWGITGDKSKAIMQSFNGDVSGMSTTALKASSKAIETMMKTEKSSYADGKKALLGDLQSGQITYQQYQDKKAAMSKRYHDTEKSYATALYKDQEAIYNKQQNAGYKSDSQLQQEATAHNQKMKALFKQYGIDYGKIMDEMGSKSKKSQKDMGDSQHIMATNTANMSKAAATANKSWNAMVYNPKTGKVQTNAQAIQTIAKKANSDWNGLKYMLKNANLSTNARVTTEQALQQAGKWNGLSVKDKELVLGNSKAIKAVVESKDNLATWNSMSPKDKELLLKDQQALEALANSKGGLQAWDKLSPKEKELKAKDLTGATKAQAQKVINSLTGKDVNLTTSNKAKPGKDSSQATVNSYIGKDVNLTASNKAIPGKTSSQNTVNSFIGKSVPLWAINQAGAGKASSQGTVNSFIGKGVSLWATNNTWGAVGSAKGAIGSVPNSKTSEINANDDASAKADAVRNKLDSIPPVVTSTIHVVSNIAKALGFAKGTDYFTGGMAWVNDQKGKLYKELITLPDGKSFIPQQRDVILPLPKGTKILPAAQTSQMMSAAGIPKFADGVGYKATTINYSSASSLGTNIGKALASGLAMSLGGASLKTVSKAAEKLMVAAAGNKAYQAEIKKRGSTVAKAKAAASKARADELKKIDSYNKTIAKKRIDLTNSIKTINTNVSNANSTFESTMKKINSDLSNDVNDAVTQRVTSLENFSSIFDKISHTRYTTDTLTKNLQDQVTTMSDWQNNLNKISQNGGSADFVAMLRDMGVESADNVATLASMSKTQLAQYQALMNQKQKLAQAEADSEAKDAKTTLGAQVKQLVADTTAKADAARTTWNNAMKKAASDLDKLKSSYEKSGVDLGSSAVKGVISGINNNIKKLQDKMQQLSKLSVNTTVTKKATGDRNFAGGLAMVNDQRGRVYKELITLPTGQSFVPEARNVIMALPKGTNILKASDTAKLIPKYAGGTGGIPDNLEIFQKMDAVRANYQASKIPDNTSQFRQMIKLLSIIADKDPIVNMPSTPREPTTRENNQAFNRLLKQIAYMAK